jgi:hypothetical protein
MCVRPKPRFQRAPQLRSVNDIVWTVVNPCGKWGRSTDLTTLHVSASGSSIRSALPQTRRSYQCVKLRRGCEGVTVCRRVAARAARTSQDHVVRAAQEGLPGCCNGLACTLGGPVSLCKRSITFQGFIHAYTVVVTHPATMRRAAPRPRQGRVTDVARHRTTTLRCCCCVAFTNGRLGMDISAGQWLQKFNNGA